MPEFLRGELQAAAEPLVVLGRLVASMLLGGVVAWIYKRTRPESDTASSLAVTLVLLAILIAMVTQVIGDNVARAFSLVGALSIVRFRTVVRDTVDTAFVIFAVAVGMAAGASHLSVAISGIAVVGLAAWFMTRGDRAAGSEVTYLLQVRVGLGHDVEGLLNPALAPLRQRQTAGCHVDRQTGLGDRGHLRDRAPEPAVGGRVGEGAQPHRGCAGRRAES